MKRLHVMDVKSNSVKLTSSAEESVHRRYSAAAGDVEPALCCPVNYDRRYLEILPEEILERDYGCGDPSRYVRRGEAVLDLGSGGGKVCYIAAQIVGPEGKVIGVDCNDEMLSLARKYRGEIAGKLGYDNVEFRRGMIQDLRLDLDLLSEHLAASPVADHAGWLELRHLEQRLRSESPLVADESVDCVVSNCVLNLVRPDDRRALLAEVYRVLKNGGRAAISDIVSDEDVPDEMQNDPELWSGCISGAWREDAFLKVFEEAGFHGIQLADRGAEPWQTVKGIEFRSVTVVAYKGKDGPCLERNQAVIYTGPFQRVVDDDGHTYHRGDRMAVCDKTFHLLQHEPYTGMFEPVEPRRSIPIEDAQPFDCTRTARRDLCETKGADYKLTVLSPDGCCGPGESCC